MHTHKNTVSQGRHTHRGVGQAWEKSQRGLAACTAEAACALGIGRQSVSWEKRWEGGSRRGEEMADQWQSKQRHWVGVLRLCSNGSKTTQLS